MYRWAALHPGVLGAGGGGFVGEEMLEPFVFVLGWCCSAFNDGGAPSAHRCEENARAHAHVLASDRFRTWGYYGRVFGVFFALGCLIEFTFISSGFCAWARGVVGGGASFPASIDFVTASLCLLLTVPPPAPQTHDR